jgi:hypothetical protein
MEPDFFDNATFAGFTLEWDSFTHAVGTHNVHANFARGIAS